ncbi:MAG: hypothetical protein ACTSRS_01085 [Candidatus Helarchaeota archaeon]
MIINNFRGAVKRAIAVFFEADDFLDVESSFGELILEGIDFYNLIVT